VATPRDSLLSRVLPAVLINAKMAVEFRERMRLLPARLLEAAGITIDGERVQLLVTCAKEVGTSACHLPLRVACRVESSPGTVPDLASTYLRLQSTSAEEVNRR